jgi:hypothetical protein
MSSGLSTRISFASDLNVGSLCHMHRRVCGRELDGVPQLEQTAPGGAWSLHSTGRRAQVRAKLAFRFVKQTTVCLG